MRVCHVWERFWPIEIGGLERYILGLTSYLAKSKEYDFSLLTGRSKIRFITKRISKFEDAGFLKVYRLGPSPIDLVNGVFFSAFHSTPNLVEKAMLADLYREASNSQVAKSADVFHIHGIWSDLEYINLGIYLSRRFKKPLVLTLHGGFVGDPMHGGMPLESPVVREILQKDATQITTYCKEVLVALYRMGLGYKSHLITNFVDAYRFANPPEPKLSRDVTVVYVGRLERVQTPEIVIKAFKQVADQYSQAKLLIVGYGTMYTELRSLVKELNLEHAVSMLGKQTDVRKFLWNSDIFVATNFGYIASLEAMSAGLAVVAPNFGILKETIVNAETGLLVEEHNVNQLASALISLIKDEALRRKLAANGRQFVQHYDIREVAPKMAGIYQLAVEKRI